MSKTIADGIAVILPITEKLMEVQSELKAPKNLKNTFGNYKYRNFEGICEAVKPVLAKYGLALIVTDEIVNIADRFYVKANATLLDVESNDSITVCALAREATEKKGMDDAQITGAASSYARKYALNGLFLLDDTKDPDSDEYQAVRKEPLHKLDPKRVEEINKGIKDSGLEIDSLLSFYKVPSVEALTEKQYEDAMGKIRVVLEKKKSKEVKKDGVQK